MRIFWLLMLLAACNAPSRAFRDAAMTQVTVQGSVFHVRVSGAKAEAIRVNREYAPRMGPIGARAVFAMQQVSGCAVAKISGDAAVVVGTLRCGTGSHVWPKGVFIPQGAELECYGVDSFVSGATGELITDYDCDVITE